MRRAGNKSTYAACYGLDMPKTIAAGPLQEGRSKEDETFSLVNLLLNVAQQEFKDGPFTLNTTTAAIGTIWTSDDEIPEKALWAVSARVQGQSAAVHCSFVSEALFFRASGGVATQEGATTAISTIRTDANLSVAVGLVGNKLTVTVADAAARAVSWAAWLSIRISRLAS